MKRITVDVSSGTYQYLAAIKKQRGSAISFEANQLIESAIKERNRKKKKDGRETESDERAAH